MKLQDKVAIVTGGGRGLGRSIALLFGKEGAKVVVAARNQNQIEHVAQELKGLRKNAIAIRPMSPMKTRSIPWFKKPWRPMAPSISW